MPDPETLVPVSGRRREDAAAMAVAVQANLVTLKVAASRRAHRDPAEHPIRLSPPGAVRQFRETLIDRHVVAAYADDELMMRTRELWGQWCVFCWAFQCDDPNDPADFAHLPPTLIIRSTREMLAKEAAVVKTLWRLRHEQRFRFDPDARHDPAFQREREIAQTIPARVYDTDIRLCGHNDLIACTCEHAGMLAAIRWLIDDRRAWGEPGIMEIASGPPA